VATGRYPGAGALLPTATMFRRAFSARRRFFSAEEGRIRAPTIRPQCRFRIGREKTKSSQPPDQRPLLRPLFVILLCTGYVYVPFFFFLMFRTILLPDLAR
jgi:hypothetical protein